MIAFYGAPEKLHLLPQAETDIVSHVTDIGEAVAKLKNARHYAQIILDFSLFDNTPADFIKALYLLKSLNSTNLIIIAQGVIKGDPLLCQLIEIGIYNFVLSLSFPDAKQELMECMKGKTLEDVSFYLPAEIQKTSPFDKLKAHKRKQISIQMIGVYPRIGVTTQAIRLTKSMIANGYKACYSEQNTSNHLAVIKEVYADVEHLDEMTICYAGVPLSSHSLVDLQAYDYVVTDYGAFQTPAQLSELNASAKTIVVAGSAAWEMAALPALMDCLQQFTDMHYLFSFTDKKEQDDILEYMGEHWTTVHFAEYVPDMFSELSETEKTFYRKIVCDTAKSKFHLPRI